MTDGSAEAWWTQAQEDLGTARLLHEHRRFAQAAFHLQQAVEKALKALLVHRGDELPRTHDCYFLAEEAGAPQDVLQAADDVTPYYFRTRYPDAGLAEVTQEDLDLLFDAGEEVMVWTQSKR